MDKENNDKIPADAGMDSLWLVALAERNLEQPKIWSSRDVREIAAKRPDSRIQGYLQQFYWDLMDKMKEFKYSVESDEVITEPDEDMFDSWYEDNGLEEYMQKYQLYTKLNTIAGALNIGKLSGYGSEEDFQKILSQIAMACIEDQAEGSIEKVADVINEMYPNLANPLRHAPSAVEMSEQERAQYDEQRRKLIESMNSNVEDFAAELAMIQAAKETEFEKIAQMLNQVVIFGTDNWELTLYSIMSSHAPRLIINGLSYRANLHYLLPGDISTAKSKILEICQMMSPKSLVVDRTTMASFEGVVKIGEDEIQEGVLDHANGGSMIVEELARDFTRLPLFRRTMDCKFIQIFKGGKKKGILVNTTLMSACNPDEDFFIEAQDTNFRKQISFKEGILSRFDIMIPLTATQVKNEMYLDKINLFGDVEEHVDYEDIKDRLSTIATGMSSIRQVVVTTEQQKALKDAFRLHNEKDMRRRILTNRPLIIYRDLEALARFVNAIASVNFSRREMTDHPSGGKILHAKDEDITKAIQLWENLLYLRIQLYARSQRNIVTIADDIGYYIHNIAKANPEYEENGVPLMIIRREFVDTRKQCSYSSFYNEIKSMRETGRVIQYGERNATVKLVIR